MIHADELTVTPDLMRHLVDSQFPHLAHLPLNEDLFGGTDHWMARLGDRLAVRLPRRPSAARQVGKEQRWLPFMAPQLPVSVPVPRHAGAPTRLWPRSWSIVDWVPGSVCDPAILADPVALARDLSAVVVALSHVPVAGGPAPGAHNFGRGCPLSRREAATQAALAELDPDLFDLARLQDIWADARAAGHTSGRRWVHGDLQRDNLLVSNGRLAGVLDWGGLAVGDPAVDLMVAWTVLPRPTRRVFREASGADALAWRRGRGWALSVAALQWPYYRLTHPSLAAQAEATLRAVLDPD